MPKATNIKWETDGYDVELPTEMEIPERFIDEDGNIKIITRTPYLASALAKTSPRFRIPTQRKKVHTYENDESDVILDDEEKQDDLKTY